MVKRRNVCIAQVEELVEPGGIDPDAVHLPGVFVHRVVEVGTEIEVGSATPMA